MTKQEEKEMGLISVEEGHNPKQSKVRADKITFTLHNPVQIDYAIKVMESEFEDLGKRDKFLYIMHDRDEAEDGEFKSVHLHAMVWGNSRRFVDWAEQFSIPDDPDNAIPANMICKVRNPRAMARYLIHKDDPDKFQYDESDVKGSPRGLEFFKKALVDYKGIDLDSELDDFSALRQGEMTPKEFLLKYRVFYSGDNFSSRMRVYTSVFENSSREKRGPGLNIRSAM